MANDEGEMSWSLSSLSEGRISLSNDGAVATHPHHRQQIDEDDVTVLQRRLEGSGIIVVRSEQKENNKRRKLKSKVWDEMSKYKDKDGNEKAECNHCRKTFDGSSKKGTTHLKNHLDRCRANNNNKRKGGAAGDEDKSSSFKTTDLATPVVAVEDNSHVSDNNPICLPPCFRFSPTDEELLVFFLCRKVAGRRLPINNFIAEIDLYKFEPWELPMKAIFGETEWYFFSPMDRLNPDGSEDNRVTGIGYWEDAGSGTDQIITTAGRKAAGVKKALVYYKGNAPNGIKTRWIMLEYRLFEYPPNNGGSKLDDWILCRISQCREQ